MARKRSPTRGIQKSRSRDQEKNTRTHTDRQTAKTQSGPLDLKIGIGKFSWTGNPKIQVSNLGNHYPMTQQCPSSHGPIDKFGSIKKLGSQMAKTKKCASIRGTRGTKFYSEAQSEAQARHKLGRQNRQGPPSQQSG